MTRPKLFILVAALLTAACDETTRPVAQTDDSARAVLAEADLPELAQATASALAAPTARHDILAAMRASRVVEHRLILADYLRSPEGAELLARAAEFFGATGDQLLARVDRLRQVAELAIAVPIREQRLTWQGGADIGVAGTWNPDAMGFIVHEPDGGRSRATTVDALGRYGGLFVIRPQENWGTRIHRQPDVPGPVIEDINDGRQAVVWTYQVEGEPPVSVDFGSYESAQELQKALSGAAGGWRVAASSHCHGDQIPVNDECPDDGGGVSRRPTDLATFTMTGGGDLFSSSEVEITVGYTNRDDSQIRGTIRREGVEVDVTENVNDEILNVSPTPGGLPFYVLAVETDSWLAGGNDELGYSTFEYTAGGKSFSLPDIDIRLNW